MNKSETDLGKKLEFAQAPGLTTPIIHVDSAESDETTKLKGLKLLVAEDVVDNQILIRTYLAGAGAEVQIANNGQEAVDFAQKEKFDLILMDIQMPVLDGLNATRKLRSLGFNGPIVALTAHSVQEEKKRSLEAGCTAHLMKPITRKALIHAILQYTPGRITE